MLSSLPTRSGISAKSTKCLETVMRLPLLSASDLNPAQRQLYDDMRKGIETDFKGFTAIDDSGRLIGPWNPWLHFSKFGGPVWELVKALSSSPKLPRPVREIAILVTGAHSR
jgi:4-carboxymuconolactone decarboxylase